LTIGTLYQSSKTVKTIGVPIVTGLPRLYQQCTNGVPVKRQSKQQKWPFVYQSSHVKRQSKQQNWPLVYQSSHAGLPRLYQQCNNSVPIVKNSQTAKKWPLEYQSSQCLHRVRRIHKAPGWRANVEFHVRMWSLKKLAGWPLRATVRTQTGTC